MIQNLLDSILRSKKFRSVQDLQYIPDDNTVYVQRRMGFKSCLIDISGIHDDESIVKKVVAHPAVY